MIFIRKACALAVNPYNRTCTSGNRGLRPAARARGDEAVACALGVEVEMVLEPFSLWLLQ
eukprot:8949351-Pyramimonas_sp.AAC.1